MELDRFREVWRRHLDAPASRAEVELIAGLVARFARETERQLLRRDIVETGVALMCAALFGLFAVHNPSLLARIGCLVVITGCVIVMVKLWSVRLAANRRAESAAVGEFLRAERENFVRQVGLLKSVLWWYLLPILLGVNLFFWGLSPLPIVSVGYLAATILLGVWLWRLNQRAVQTELLPMIEEIDRVNRQLAADVPPE